MKYPEAVIKLRSLLEFCERTYSVSEAENARNKADEIVPILSQLKKEWRVEEFIKSEKFQKRLKDLLNERFSTVVDKEKLTLRIYGIGDEFKVPENLKEFVSGKSMTINKTISGANQFSMSSYRKKHSSNTNVNKNVILTIEIEIDIDEFLKKEGI